MLLTVQHNTPEGDAAALEHLDTHQGMVDGSKAASGDKQHRQLQPADQLQNGLSPIDRYQQTTGSLDDQMGRCRLRQPEVVQEDLDIFSLSSGVWAHGPLKIIPLRKEPLFRQTAPVADLFGIRKRVTTCLYRFPVGSIQTCAEHG